MINTIPGSWSYNETLEMLFLFYQSSDEMLSEVTPDTFSLPQHNPLSLISEISEVYSLLKEHAIVDNYYKQYIPPIIEEFLSQLEEDYLLKRILGKRLFSIRTGFEEAKNNSKAIERWLGIFMQVCTPRLYQDAYKEEIKQLVTNTKDKRKLIYCAKNWYIGLLQAGYSREYLYTSGKRFFDNRNRKITESKQISDYLDLFTYKHKEFNFLVLMDVESIEYFDSLDSNIRLCKQIKKIDIASERAALCNDYKVAELFKEFDSKRYSDRSHEKLSVVYFTADSLDPYTAALDFENQIRFLQSFSRYFKHFNYSKQIFRMLLQDDTGLYHDLKLPNRYKKRPFISQNIIDSRIENILNAKSMGYSALNSIALAVAMHAEALDSRNTTTLLRTFWTALETLFSNPSLNSIKENVINSVCPIIQKTYLLKVLRIIYSQLLAATDTTRLSELGIVSFSTFVEYYASFEANSDEMKNIYGLLSNNPLLRTRLFEERNILKTGNNIGELLDQHAEKIQWQLKRLYRIRNIATHLGTEISGSDIAVNHLHNYFDYVVNYMLCKSESGDWISNISAVVFEAQNDNRIHREMLKNTSSLSKNTYMDFLFGPDLRLMSYQFE